MAAFEESMIRILNTDGYFFIFFVLPGQGGCQLQYLILWSSKKKMDQLYAEGWVSKKSYFDEEVEWRFYELWHHEGRRIENLSS